LTGIAILLLKYDSRIKYYKEIKTALATLQENSACINLLQTIQIQLLRCRETQKIDRKMREEIIPAMMKNPKLSNEKFSIDILSEIEQDEDKNPEWTEWIEKDEIKGKIEEMAKWQFEGADVYMSTFSQLKTFPFFGEITNWFRPFDTNVPEIAEITPNKIEGSKTLLSAICASPFFCNSDKYSFCFTFKQVPPEQREMLLGQIPDENEIHATDDSISKKASKEKQAETESNQYIQDLYRFFKLSNFRHEFSDPFATSLNMLESESLSSLINNNEAILRTFRYLVEKEYYNEAYNAGRIYEKCGEGDAQFYQEMGFCMQKERDFDSAIDYYTRADIIKPDPLWTLRHIAQCYRMQGESEKALSFYQMAEELAPENISLLLQTGESFAATKRYEEAFARFYKAEFLKPDSRRAIRAIAWCSFITGKDEQARGYYNRLLEMSKPAFEDYLNAAHVEWVSGNRSRAIELYNQAKECCKSTDKVTEQIMNDSEVLIARGVSEKEILLLRDMLY
jgi:tetratricopeptide (TPR) repeat protein